MRVLLPCLIAGALTQASWADTAAKPSVLVETEMPRKATVPDIVTAYGSAAPALDGGMTLSVPRDGRVEAIAITPGEMVHAGERLLDFAASAATTNAYHQAANAFALAETNRAHSAQLVAQQLATNSDLAAADKSLADAEATLAALRREGADRPRETITAPFDAIVAAIPIAQGDRVTPGAALVTLVRLDGLVVTMGVEPADRLRVRPGQTVKLSPLAGAAAMAGRILRIDHVLNPKTRLVDADASVPVGRALLGEAFRADITVGSLEGWIVPRDAVLSDAKGAYLFQVASGKAVRVEVRTIGSAGDNQVVEGPLDPQRQLVIQGNYQLADGDAVREAGGAPGK